MRRDFFAFRVQQLFYFFDMGEFMIGGGNQFAKFIGAEFTQKVGEKQKHVRETQVAGTPVS